MTSGWNGAPTAVPRPRRRRSHRGLTAFLITLVVLVGLLVAADRIGASLAAGKVADRLEGHTPFTERPEVRIHGFPFLTQALGGRYSDIEVSGSGLAISKVNGVTADAHLRGVHLSIGDVRNGIDAVPVDRIDVTLVLPWQDVNAVSGLEKATISGDSSGVTIRAPLSVPGLGSLTVSAKARVSGANDVVSVKVTSVSAGGAQLSGSALDAVSQQLNFRLPLSGLPYDIHLDSLSTGSDGLHLAGTVRDVVLRDLSSS